MAGAFSSAFSSAFDVGMNVYNIASIQVGYQVW